MTLKLIKSWKLKQQSPIQRLIAIKNKSAGTLSKEEEKLAKALCLYPEVDFQNLILEFKSTAESDLVETVELRSKPIRIEQIANTLVTTLEWEREKALQKAIEYYMKSKKTVSDLKLARIVRKVKGGKSFIIEWLIGNTIRHETKYVNLIRYGCNNG